MKRILFICSVVVTVFVAAYSFAQMGGGGMMGGQKGDSGGMGMMEHGQMMSRDMMVNMTEMMKHMNEMMDGLSHPMQHMTVTDHKEMYDLGKIMRKMASEMNEMAAYMEKGGMDAATARKIQERMKAINQEIETLQKKNK